MAKSDKENKVTVEARKSDEVDDENQVPATATTDVDADFTEEVTSNKEASDPFFVSNADPTDPNGYNNAPREADGFIANPVAGGGIPVDYDADVVNGVTQSDPEVEDLPESNVDPKGVIKKLEKSAKRQN